MVIVLSISSFVTMLPRTMMKQRRHQCVPVIYHYYCFCGATIMVTYLNLTDICNENVLTIQSYLSVQHLVILQEFMLSFEAHSLERKSVVWFGDDGKCDLEKLCMVAR